MLVVFFLSEELLREGNRSKSHVICLMEGFETVIFRSKFSKWPKKADAIVSDESRGKVAALLKRQGFNVKGLAKATPVKEEPQPQIDCTGSLQVWRVNGSEKALSFHSLSNANSTMGIVISFNIAILVPIYSLSGGATFHAIVGDFEMIFGWTHANFSACLTRATARVYNFGWKYFFSPPPHPH